MALHPGQTNRLLGYPLDWPGLRLGGRPDMLALLFRRAREFGLALRVVGQPFIEELHSQALPTNDSDFVDSYLLDLADKPAQFAQLLRDLPAGLTEWAVHPGLNTPELLAIEGDTKHVRQSDFDYLMSPAAQDTIRAEGIVLLDYRVLQAVWKGHSA